MRRNMNTKWAEVKQIREKTGLGLRESVDAWQRWGSAEEALKHLSTAAERDTFENGFARDRQQAELYRALRDSGLFHVPASGRGWATGIDFAINTADELDMAAARLMKG